MKKEMEIKFKLCIDCDYQDYGLCFNGDMAKDYSLVDGSIYPPGERVESRKCCRIRNGRCGWEAKGFEPKPKPKAKAKKKK